MQSRDQNRRRADGLKVMLEWQTEAPRGMTLPEWLAAGRPHRKGN